METWAQKYTGAWNRHSATDVAAFMTADAVFVDTTLGETFRGPQEIGQWVESMVTSFSSDFSMALRHSVVTSTGFATEWIMRGTHDGSTHQLAATGKHFDIRGATVGEVRDGKICGLRDYWDLAGFLAQVGAAMPRAGDGALSASAGASRTSFSSTNAS
jgi:steroid delta-isomerase-like uncharacterized protein